MVTLNQTTGTSSKTAASMFQKKTCELNIYNKKTSSQSFKFIFAETNIALY